MRKEILIGSLALVLLILFASGSFYAVKPLQTKQKSSPQGSVISGTVVNLEGRSMSGADVLAVPAGGFRGILPHTVTDAKGSFTIAGLEPGTYFMEARKESEGYASTRDSFTSHG